MAETTGKRHHEPLVHITRRAEMVWWKAWLIRGAAILAALVLCGVIITLLTGENPVEVYRAMFEGNFKNERKTWETLQKVSILLCIALALTPAFKMKFWNCGGNGQVLAGCMASAACMFYLGDRVSPALFAVIVVVAGMLAGAIWGFIPAFFKAHWNTNETLFTLMMNYVALQLVGFFIILWENPKNSAAVGIINSRTQGGWLSLNIHLTNSNGRAYTINILPIIVAAVLCILMYVYLKHLKQGYEISVVGESQNTARYVGINVKKVIIRTMIISGALCGLAGVLLVSGLEHTITENTVGSSGFTAMMISWLAKFNPIAMVLATFLIIFLQRGSDAIATSFGLSKDLAEIITGVILLFIIGCEFFIQYRIHFRSVRKNVQLQNAAKAESPSLFEADAESVDAAEQTSAEEELVGKEAQQ